MEQQNDINTTIARNIVTLRTGSHMTQAELAEALNYSDKAISKWERAASIPDVSVLKQIADLFGVTVDYIITVHEETAPFQKPDKSRNHMTISLLSFCGIWLAVIIAATVLWILKIKLFWLVCVAAMPVSILVVLILICVFAERKYMFASISALIWSSLAAIFLFLEALLPVNGYQFWPILLIGLPAELVVYLSCTLAGKDMVKLGVKAIDRLNIGKKK